MECSSCTEESIVLCAVKCPAKSLKILFCTNEVNELSIDVSLVVSPLSNLLCCPRLVSLAGFFSLSGFTLTPGCMSCFFHFLPFPSLLDSGVTVNFLWLGLIAILQELFGGTESLFGWLTMAIWPFTFLAWLLDLNCSLVVPLCFGFAFVLGLEGSGSSEGRSFFFALLLYDCGSSSFSSHHHLSAVDSQSSQSVIGEDDLNRPWDSAAWLFELLNDDDMLVNLNEFETVRSEIAV